MSLTLKVTETLTPPRSLECAQEHFHTYSSYTHKIYGDQIGKKKVSKKKTNHHSYCVRLLTEKNEMEFVQSLLMMKSTISCINPVNTS